MRNIVLLYMPVIHRGYLDFLMRYASHDVECVLIGNEALNALGEKTAYALRKDSAIRGVPTDLVADFIRQRDLFKEVSILEPVVEESSLLLTMPDEDVSNYAAKAFFPKAAIVLSHMRLRYDRKGTQREDAVPATVCTTDYAARELMRLASSQAGKSKDWWLSVGAIVARNGVPLFAAYNVAALDPDLPNILGDPRSSYLRGENTDDTLVLHAERQLVAHAARDGVSLDGTDVYVTHFPCLPCAGMLVGAGVKRVFFKQGYSRLEGAEYLASNDVEMIKVSNLNE